MVCQAISIAITIVFPAPVASLRASRDNSGLASRLAASRCLRNPFASWPLLGATSVSQMTVSTASIWQKKGRILLKWWLLQCRSRRAVSGVTPHWLESGSARHWSTCLRTPLMIALRSYCWSLVSSLLAASSNTRAACCSDRPLRLLGCGIGVMKSAGRRVPTIFWVGCPSASSSQ